MAEKLKKYPSREAAVFAYLVMLLKYVGIKELSGYHEQILARYRMIQPRPRGYNPTNKDSWCAIFVCALAWALGFRDWPWECSCSMIRYEAMRRGIWRSGWETTVKPGMWVIYDWQGDGGMDHIGVVVAVEGNEVVIVEGNYDNAVKIRRIKIGDKSVAGFVDLDYGELVEVQEESVEALRPGGSGNRVRVLQAFLAGAGYYVGNLDGDYGSATTLAVEGFQAANGLDVDGKAGPKTQARIKSGEWIAKRREVQAMPEKRYNSIEELPEYAKGTIRQLVEQGHLSGREDGMLDLSDDMIRVLEIFARAWGFPE